MAQITKGPSIHVLLVEMIRLDLLPSLMVVMLVGLVATIP
jgi:hypothetical protein